MLKTNIFEKYNYNNIFIETGSYLGDGIQLAIDANFKNIYSIELSDKYYNISKDRFKERLNVEIIKGDSAIVLKDTIENINESITFWLDGHYSCSDTARGIYRIPLMQELEHIKNHKIKSHTILIDDMRCWQEPNKEHGFYIDDIIKYLEIMNYEIMGYEDGIEKNDVMVLRGKNND